MCLWRSASNRRRHGDAWMDSESGSAAVDVLVRVPGNRGRPEWPRLQWVADRKSALRGRRLQAQHPIPPVPSLPRSDYSRRSASCTAADRASLLYLSLTRCCAAQPLRTLGPRSTTVGPFSCPASWRSRGEGIRRRHSAFGRPITPGLPFYSRQRPSLAALREGRAKQRSRRRVGLCPSLKHGQIAPG